ncbi:ATP-binding protein [Paenibacillaceae bacterium]|nr:ATP-binding protein [Paenibacillaceae bacterium]
MDIFNPKISRIAEGLEGKIISVIGGNSTGKTKQLTRLKKPFYLPFEGGLGAIDGVPYEIINSWGDFKKLNKQLTNPKTLDKVKELYQTIIFDEIWASSKYCQGYICDKYESDSIKSGNAGYGLWSEYETEFFTEISKLISCGYTVGFIGHVSIDEDGKAWPKGDKRALGPIIDNSDIVIYLKSNGTDKDGNVIKSSAYLAETEEYFARSRFDYITPFIKEFTAENLEKAVNEAIEKEKKINGVKTVTAKEQLEMNKPVELEYDDLMNQLKIAGSFIHKNGRNDETVEIIEKHLGRDKKITDATKSQVQVLSVILHDLEDIVEEIKSKAEEEDDE